MEKETAVTFRLVGGETDRLFYGIPLDRQIRTADLMEKVRVVTNIPTKYQILKLHGEDLPNVEHPIQDIKFGEEIVVKHALLRKWSEYLEYCKNASDMRNEKPKRTKFAHEAIACSKVMEESGMLEAYIKFVPQWIDTFSQMMRLIDTTRDAFEESATTFFSKMYPNSKIDFKPKEKGSRAGTVVAVTCDDEEEDVIYYMKTYHRIGSFDSFQNKGKRYPPDLREMFAYRLLELLGVGPVVFFPSYAPSTNIHCIATKEVKGFKEVDKIEDISLQRKVLVEAYLILLILGIRDLNEGNFGSNEDKTLSIIDFYVPDGCNFQRRNILNDLKMKSRLGGEVNGLLIKIGHEERIKIAKEALPNWSRIKNMTSDIIDVERRELQEQGIRFGTDTEQLEDYLQDIKFNYDTICSAL